MVLLCLGCDKALRRTIERYYPNQLALCPSCKSAVTVAYEAKLHADGILPSVMPGSEWLPAWNRLSLAVANGDREFLAPFLP